MALASSSFPARRTRVQPRRNRRLRGADRPGSLVMESLERRQVMAVTSLLEDGVLRITLAAENDVASLSSTSQGGKDYYLVRGTGHTNGGYVGEVGGVTSIVVTGAGATMTDEATGKGMAMPFTLASGIADATDTNKLTAIKIDGVAPAVTNVELPNKGLYKTGDTLQFVVTFDDDVTYTKGSDDATLEFTIGGAPKPVQARIVGAALQTGKTLTFAYTIAKEDDSYGVIFIEQDAIKLGGSPISTIRDANGNDADFSDTKTDSNDVAVNRLAASVSVAAKTYKAGDEIEIKANFGAGNPLTVTGTPKIGIKVGETQRVATYFAKEDGTLNFRYKVEQNEVDTDGIEIPESVIDLAGGDIKDGSDNPVYLPFSLANGVDLTTVLVDGQAPTVATKDGVTMPAAGVYKTSDTLTVTIKFTEPVRYESGSGDATLAVKIGDKTVPAKIDAPTGLVESLTFSYPITSADESSGALAVGLISLNGSKILDAPGNPADLEAATNSVANVAVNRLAATVSVAAKTYKAGDNIDLVADFGEGSEVIVEGTPSISITIGDAKVDAEYVSGVSTKSSLTFRYPVKANDNAPNGISIPNQIFDLLVSKVDGSFVEQIRDDKTGKLVALPFTLAAGELTTVKVDAKAPAVLALTDSDPDKRGVTMPAGGVYTYSAETDTTLKFTIRFDEAFTYTKSGSKDAELTISLDGTPRTATLESLTETSLTFSYTITNEDSSSGTVSLAQDAIKLPTGADQVTLLDAAGNAANTELPAAVSVSNVVINRVLGSLNINDGAAKTFKQGDHIDLVVDYGEGKTITVDTVAGKPRIAIKVGDQSTYADYQSFTGSTVTFRYTVADGDLDPNGIEIPTTEIDLNLGNIEEAVDGGSKSVALPFTVPADLLAGIKVDGKAPSVVRTTMPAAGVYTYKDDTPTILTFTVTFDEKVTYKKATDGAKDTVLRITIGTNPRDAVLRIPEGPTDTLTFDYTILADDDSTGVVEMNAIVADDEAGAGTLEDEAGNAANPAVALNDVTNVVVNRLKPTVRVTPGLYKVDDFIDIEADFGTGNKVFVTVAAGKEKPTVNFLIDSFPKAATYVSGSGSSKLLFRYKVEKGDVDEDGIVLQDPPLEINPNDAAIIDANDKNVVLTFANVDSSTVKVDGVAAKITGVSMPKGGLYAVDEKLRFVVSFDEDVAYAKDGTKESAKDAELRVRIGTTLRKAVLVAPTAPTRSLTFEYTVDATDDTAGVVSIGGDAIDLNDSSIKDVAGNKADLTNTRARAANIAIKRHQANVNVNNGVAKTYKVGDKIDLIADFGEGKVVTVDGTPTITLRLDGDKTRVASYVPGAGSRYLTFRYTVAKGDLDLDGIVIPSLAFDLPTGGNSFTVTGGPGNVLKSSLTVKSTVESTTVVGKADVDGTIKVESAKITLAGDVKTTGDQEYLGAVGLSGDRTLTATAGSVTFQGTVDSSPLIFADPDSIGEKKSLKTAFSGMTISQVVINGDGTEVKAVQGTKVTAPDTTSFAPTGTWVFGDSSPDQPEAWNYQKNELKAPPTTPTGDLLRVQFDQPVRDVSFDFVPFVSLGDIAENPDLASPFIQVYLGDKVFDTRPSKALPAPITQATTLSYDQSESKDPRPINIVEATWWSDADKEPSLGRSGMIDNLRATLYTTPQYSLTVNANKATTFKSEVGSIAKLSTLTTDKSGTTVIGTRRIDTEKAQTYNDDVVLAADATLAGVNVSFGGRVDAQTEDDQSLSVFDDSGETTFGGIVGGKAALSSLSTDKGGTTRIAGGLVKTTGTQTYNDQLVLGESTRLEGLSGTLAGGVDGNDKGLTLTFSDVTTIVGGEKFTNLASLATDGLGKTVLSGTIGTSAGQTYADQVLLAADTTLRGTAIEFKSTVDAVTAEPGEPDVKASLVSEATASTTFAGAVGGGKALVSLATTKPSGQTSINGGGVTTTGEAGQSFAGDVSLGQDTILAAGTGPIEFKGKVDGKSTLTANSTGATTFGGAVTLVSLATNAGGTTAINGGAITTTGAAGQVFGDDVSLGKDTTLAADAGPIEFKGKLDGKSAALTANSTGATTFAGAVTLASLATNAGGTTAINGGAITTTGAAGQVFGDDVSLGQDTTLGAGTGPIEFKGKLDAKAALTANSTGATTFGGAVTLVSLATNAGGTTAINGGAITTTGAAGQVYGDDVSLGQDTTLDAGTGPIEFKGKVDGKAALTAKNSTGTTTFGGAVTLVSLATDAGGTTAINGGALTTTGAAGQVFGDDVTLGQNTTLGAGTGPIEFKGKLDGKAALTANSTGTTTFSGVVTLVSLATDAKGTTAINGGAITTTGAAGQVFGDDVSLGQDTTFDAGTGPIEFKGKVDGKATLTANSTGATTFGGAVTLVSLATDAKGTTAINGGSITTTGAAGQVFGDDVTLGQNTTLDAGTGPITFNGKVEGKAALVANSSGTTTFGGAVTLVSLATDTKGTTAINGGAITTTGAAGQVYGDDVSLGQDTTLDAGIGPITFNGKVDGVDGNAALTANSTGATTFGGAVTLVSLATDAKGTTAINGGSITTTGAAGQVFGDDVSLGQDTTLDAGTGPITFNGKVDGKAALTANSTGTTTFGGAVTLVSLATDADGTTAINGGAITTTGAAGQVFGDAVSIGAATTFTSLPGGNVTFQEELGGSFPVVVAAGTGNLLFAKAVGSVAPLAGLAVNSAASVTAQAAITLDGSAAGAAADGLAVAATVPKVSIANGGTVRNFSGNGVVFAGGSAGSTLSGLTVTGNRNGLVFQAGDYADTLIRGNTITNQSGDGIVLANAGKLTIGGDALASQGNTVTANKGNGIRVLAGDYSGTVIRGNTISNNGLDGVRLAATVAGSLSIRPHSVTTIGNLTIGGNALASQGNIVTANSGNGIRATTGTFTGTRIAGNTISQNGDVNTRVGDGILIAGSELTVGSATPTFANPDANTITGNAANGIRVVGSGARSNAILSNAIYLNGFVSGNKVVGDGIAVTAGAQGGLQAPAVLSAAQKGRTVFVIVTLPNETDEFLVQVFANEIADARSLENPDLAGYEGRKPVGSKIDKGATTTLEIDADRFLNCNMVTATVTRITGSVPTETSAISLAEQVRRPPNAVPAGTAEAYGATISALPGARLYSAKTGEVLVDVGDETSQGKTDLVKHRLTQVYSPGFAQNFTGGLRVTSADVDRDGFEDLITVPAGVPSWMTPRAAAAFRTTYAADLGRVGIFSGNSQGTWQATGFSAGPNARTGQVFVTVTDLNTSSPLPEIVLAVGGQTTKVLAFENSAKAGTVPTFAAFAAAGKSSLPPVARSIGNLDLAGSVTGLTGGVFDADGKGRVVVATLAGTTTSLNVLTLGPGNTFTTPGPIAMSNIRMNVGNVKNIDIFGKGATLAVGDFDNDDNDRVDLVVGAAKDGWSHFGIVPGEMLMTRNQGVIRQQLAGGSDSRYPMERAFRGSRDTIEPYTVNGRLTIWAADGNEDGRADVFASIGSSNRTARLVANGGDAIRALMLTEAGVNPSTGSKIFTWATLALNDGTRREFTVATPKTVSGKSSRFFVGSGINLS